MVHSFQLLVPIEWKRSCSSSEGSPVSISLLGGFLRMSVFGAVLVTY